MSPKDSWDRLPRMVRGGALLFAGGALGGLATWAVVSPAPGGERGTPAVSYASFPVGVDCNERPSSIVTTHVGDTFRLRCVNRDGSPGVVAVLAELDPTRDNLDSTVYDEVVWVTSPDLARDNTIIRFDVAGDDGTATIGTATDVGPIVNSSQINVIARVW